MPCLFKQGSTLITFNFGQYRQSGMPQHDAF